MSDADDELVERLAVLGSVRAKRMFGGVGVYRGGACFAIAWRGALYFKVDDSTRGDYERAGMGPFRPLTGKPDMRGYFEVPLRVLDDERELCAWAERSLAVAAAKAGRRKESAPRTRLRNLGPVSRRWLAEAGIRTRADLERAGSVAAFRAVATCGPRPSLNLLYALEAALLDVHWMRLPEALKRDLRAAVRSGSTEPGASRASRKSSR